MLNEHHYHVGELAGIWGFSAATIRRLFRNESGVLRLEGQGVLSGKRQFVTLRIPESVAERVHERLTLKRVEVRRRMPQREVVRLRDRRQAA